MRRTGQALLIGYLTVCLLVIGAFPSDGQAALMPDGGVLDQSRARDADLQRIQASLEAKQVAQRLSDVGLTPQEVQARLASYSDQQLHQVAQSLDGVQPGGELILILAIIGAIVLILAIIGLARHAI